MSPSFGYTVLGFGSGVVGMTSATGGTVTTSGDYKIHTFTSSGDFVVSSGGTDVEFLVIAGGGGGGGGGGANAGGGAGAGGYRASWNSETSGGGGSSETAIKVTPQTYGIVVGAGGAKNVYGVDLVVGVGVGAGIGWGLDRLVGSEPWLLALFSILGFVAGLMARGCSPMQAAETAAWLHVECALSYGPGLIAEDIPEELPKIFRTLGV